VFLLIQFIPYDIVCFFWYSTTLYQKKHTVFKRLQCIRRNTLYSKDYTVSKETHCIQKTTMYQKKHCIQKTTMSVFLVIQCSLLFLMIQCSILNTVCFFWNSVLLMIQCSLLNTVFLLIHWTTLYHKEHTVFWNNSATLSINIKTEQCCNH
jgi:hypothetical protein